MPEGENFENTLLEYHTFGTDAPVWAFFLQISLRFGLFYGFFNDFERNAEIFAKPLDRSSSA
jgi:hypothetical protein